LDITKEFFKRRFPDKDIEFEKVCGYSEENYEPLPFFKGCLNFEIDKLEDYTIIKQMPLSEFIKYCVENSHKKTLKFCKREVEGKCHKIILGGDSLTEKILTPFYLFYFNIIQAWRINSWKQKRK